MRRRGLVFGLYGSVVLALPPEAQRMCPTLKASAAATAKLESVLFMSLAFRGFNLQALGLRESYAGHSEVAFENLDVALLACNEAFERLILSRIGKALRGIVKDKSLFVVQPSGCSPRSRG